MEAFNHRFGIQYFHVSGYDRISAIRGQRRTLDPQLSQTRIFIAALEVSSIGSLQTVLFELIELEAWNWPIEFSSVHSLEQIGPVAKVRVQLGSHLAG